MISSSGSVIQKMMEIQIAAFMWMQLHEIHFI